MNLPKVRNPKRAFDPQRVRVVRDLVHEHPGATLETLVDLSSRRLHRGYSRDITKARLQLLIETGEVQVEAREGDQKHTYWPTPNRDVILDVPVNADHREELVTA